MDGGAYSSEARSWSDISPCAADMAANSLPGGGGGYQLVTEGIDIRLAHQLPGKPAEDHAPHHPSDKLSWWRCSDLKLEQSLAGAGASI